MLGTKTKGSIKLKDQSRLVMTNDIFIYMPNKCILESSIFFILLQLGEFLELVNLCQNFEFVDLFSCKIFHSIKTFLFNNVS
jgi:hypothetical protein